MFGRIRIHAGFFLESTRGCLLDQEFLEVMIGSSHVNIGPETCWKAWPGKIWQKDVQYSFEQKRHGLDEFQRQLYCT